MRRYALQINSQGTDKKHKRNIKDNKVYPITGVFNHMIQSEGLAENVS